MSILDELKRIQQNYGRDQDGAIRALHDLAPNVSTAEDAERFTMLVNHLVGHRKSNWVLAYNLNSTFINKPDFRTSVKVQRDLAIACYLSNEWQEGIAAETWATAAAGTDGTAVVASIRLATAEGLMRKQEWDFCVVILLPGVALAGLVDHETDFDTAIASSANNVASGFLVLENRTPIQSEVMEKTALISYKFWLNAGNWLHQERADYLMALVYNDLSRFSEAREVASRALETIDSNGDEPIDKAFINVELALACRELGESQAYDQARYTADELAKSFTDKGLSDWFNTKFARIA